MLSSTSMVKPKQDIPTRKDGDSKHADILSGSVESKLEKLCTGNDKSRCRRSKTGMANPEHAELLAGSNKSRWTWSNVDRMSPKQVTPKTETVNAIQPILLTNKLLPKRKKSKTNNMSSEHAMLRADRKNSRCTKSTRGNELSNQAKPKASVVLPSCA